MIRSTLRILWNSLLTIRVTFWQLKQSSCNSLLTSDTVYFSFTLKLLVDNKSNFLTSETVYFAFTLKLLVMLGDATVYWAIITLKLLVYKWEPFLDNVLSRSRPVREWELRDGHPWNKYQISFEMRKHHSSWLPSSLNSVPCLIASLTWAEGHNKLIKSISLYKSLSRLLGFKANKELHNKFWPTWYYKIIRQKYIHIIEKPLESFQTCLIPKGWSTILILFCV